MNHARGENEWSETFGGGFTPTGSRMIQVPVELLDAWHDPETGREQPFRPYTAAELAELTENIRQHGIITPLRLRPVGNRFQILSGHNRCKAAKAAGLRTVPAIVEDVDDDTAAEILVDSNLQQRQTILPSEKAFAYKMKLEAMKRQAGRPKKEAEYNLEKNSGQVVHHLQKTRELLAEDSGEGGRTIQRYIRLTFLTPELLQMVDEGKVKLVAGVELSFLSHNMQEIVLRLMREEGAKLSTSKAQLLHRVQPETEEEVRSILTGRKKAPCIAFKLTQADLMRSAGLTEGEFALLETNTEYHAALLQAATSLAVQYARKDANK